MGGLPKYAAFGRCAHRSQGYLGPSLEHLCCKIFTIDELTYDRPLNYIEAAMVTALLRAARQFRSLSPKSNYRTVYELTVNNQAVCSFKLKAGEVQIVEHEPGI